MKNLLFSVACALLVAFVFSCKNEVKTPDTPTVVQVGSQSMNKLEGLDCDKPDTLRTNCVTISLEWPVVEQGSDALKNAVSGWSQSYLTSILAPSEDSTASPASLEAAVQGFVNEQVAFSKDAEGSPMGLWEANSQDSILLNDGKYLTLEILGYIYAGGAHGSPTAAVVTFEAETGRQLTWDDLVSDTSALESLAEKKFREVRSDIFQPTDGNEPFEFDEIFQFALPLNFGLVKEGIYCYYMPYEVGPYAIGDTQMVITFAELGAISKIK
jgi:hypothetical protein